MSTRGRRRDRDGDRARERVVSETDAGLGPETFFFHSLPPAQKRDRSRRRDRNAERPLQICRQAAEQLGLVLAGELDDPALWDVGISAVWPDGPRLVVEVWLPPEHPASPDVVLRRLNAAQGILRGAVAQAIHRKRTPNLVFRVVGYLSTDLEEAEW